MLIKIAIDLLSPEGKLEKYSPVQKEKYYQACSFLLEGKGKELKKIAKDLSALNILQDVIEFGRGLVPSPEEKVLNYSLSDPKLAMDKFEQDFGQLLLEDRIKVATTLSKKAEEKGTIPTPLVQMYSQDCPLSIQNLDLTTSSRLMELRKLACPKEETFYKVAAQALNYIETKEDLVKLAYLIEEMDKKMNLKKENPLRSILDHASIMPKKAEPTISVEGETFPYTKALSVYESLFGTPLSKDEDLQTVISSLPKPDRLMIKSMCKGEVV